MEWDEAQTFPLDVVRKLGKLGYLGSIFPEELGGAGLGYIEYSIIIEELSRVSMARWASSWRRTPRCARTTSSKWAADEQRRVPPEAGHRRMDRLLVADRAGSRLGRRRHAHHGGLDDGVLGAERRQDFTTNAHYADVCVAMAVTDRAAAQHGISAFIIEKGDPPASASARRRTSSGCAPAPPAR